MYVAEDLLRGMKIHRTKMGCLNASTNQQQRTAQAGKTSENQSQVHTAVLRKSTLRSLTKNSDSSSTLNARSAKEQWVGLDSKIILQLDKLIGKSTFRHKLTTFGDIIYQTCLNTFGAKQHQAKREPKKSRRQHEMETLRKQKKKLRKQMKSATEEEKNGLQELWRSLKARHSALSRSESARKKRSQKKKNQERFYKDPLQFARQLFQHPNQVPFQ